MQIGILFPLSILPFIFMVTFLYFEKNNCNEEKTKVFKKLIIVNIISLVIEVIYYVLLTNNYNNLLLMSIIIKLFLISLVLYNGLYSLYIYLLSKNRSIKEIKKSKRITYLLLIIMFIIIGILNCEITNSNNHVIIIGSSVNFMYICLSIFIYFILLYMTLNIKNILKNNNKLIILLTITLIISICYGFKNPEYLVISYFETFLALGIYLTSENPDNKRAINESNEKIIAQKANQAKSDFLSSMSHEIRTPLNAIIGFSEDICNYKGDYPLRIKEDAQDIQVASQNLLEIVGNILDINKIESNKLEIANLPYDLRQTALEISKINSIRIGDKPIEFETNISDDLPNILIGDKVHIKDILNNLVSNAIKYTDKGFVNFNIDCKNNKNTCNLIISVEDSGHGIKEEDIKKLFNKFERLGVNKKSTTEGTGLGLSITKKIIEMMNGTISVDSTYGKGSTFKVELSQKIGKELNEEKKVKSNKEIDYSNKKVLVVDDNQLNIKVASRALSNLNINIDSVTSGQKCIDKINDGNKYDVILMDIMMPEKSGEETLEVLKQNKNFKTPVIALTADALSGSREKYLNEGFVDYISKPFSKDQIKEKLDNIFDK